MLYEVITGRLRRLYRNLYRLKQEYSSKRNGRANNDIESIPNQRMDYADSEDRSRITSYNVCYTKLLRAFGGLFHVHAHEGAQAVVDDARGDGQAAHAETFIERRYGLEPSGPLGDGGVDGEQALFQARLVDRMGRITSYNVCYTKLLRARRSPARSAGSGP